MGKEISSLHIVLWRGAGGYSGARGLISADHAWG